MLAAEAWTLLTASRRSQDEHRVIRVTVDLATGTVQTQK